MKGQTILGPALVICRQKAAIWTLRPIKLGSYAQFAPGVYVWPCEQCFKNLHPGANPLRVQIVHMNAKCVFSIRFDRRF